MNFKRDETWQEAFSSDFKCTANLLMVIWRRTDHFFNCTMLKIPRFFSGSCWTMKQRPLIARWSGTTAHAHKERWLGVTWRDLALEKAIMSGDIDLGKHGACALRACTSPRCTKSQFKISVMEHIDSCVACFQKKLISQCENIYLYHLYLC